MIVTRFAPSPNGPLHLGHAFSAITAHDLARANGGRFLLRIEDIDGARSRPELAQEFRDDLAWLGLTWEEVPQQSARLARYAGAARQLRERGLLYPCSCTRAEIAAQGVTVMAEAGQGAGELIYGGRCRVHGPVPGRPVAWRIDMAKAMELAVTEAGPLTWDDDLAGEQLARPDLAGDVVLVRKDEPSSYHLSATLDDAADGVTLVTRGMDLFDASHIHRLLQQLLALPVPRWHHHPLLLDDDGRKLAKRRGSGVGTLGLAERRQAGDDGRALADQLRRGDLPGAITIGSG